MLMLLRVGDDDSFLRGVALLLEMLEPKSAAIMQSSIRLLEATHLLHLMMVITKALERPGDYECLRRMYNSSISVGGQSDFLLSLPPFKDAEWPCPFHSCQSSWCRALAAELRHQITVSYHNHLEASKPRTTFISSRPFSNFIDKHIPSFGTTILHSDHSQPSRVKPRLE